MAQLTTVVALAYVLREGRLLLGESPEQVGGSLRISGRTIRRLEAAQSARPRDITLTTLASYYGMNAEFVRWLARVEVAGPKLEEQLRHRAELSGLRPREEPLSLALMLARHRPAPRRDRRELELESLKTAVELLTDRRRRLVRQFVDELRLAQCEEVRRREHTA